MRAEDADFAIVSTSRSTSVRRSLWLRRHEPRLWQGWTALVLLAAAVAFLGHGLQQTGGHWPAPLDDTYIYYGFARSWATGHPMAWFPGNGYSSGCTSALYPLLLAPGYALGLRGADLGAFAAALALVCLFDLCRSLRLVLDQRLASWAVAPLMVSIPLLDWSWFSGMETALWAALLGRAVLAAHRCAVAPPHRRAYDQLGLGLWLALLSVTRPETVALALLLATAASYRARSLRTLPSLTRTLGPTALALSGQAATNRLLTGEWAPAGAVRKLLSSSPFIEPPSLAIEYLKNLFVLFYQGFEWALGGGLAAWSLALLALLAIGSKRLRPLAIALLLGAVATVLVVCVNATARYQNLRYVAPSLAMLLCVGALGLGTVAHGCKRLRRGRWGRRAATSLALLATVAAVGGPYGQWHRQVDHFARASRNILDQQGEVARRLLELQPKPRRILVGDAGAIPYLSRIPAIDGLGLGGFRRLPFARASVHGTPAVVELIERLPAMDRPDVLALYPSWWTGLADVFGRPIDRVRIWDNVICAADEKVIYRADWSTLAANGVPREGEIAELDVADLVSERLSGYGFSAPRAGRLIAATRALRDDETTETQRYDGGRSFPPGGTERFVLATRPAATATLVALTDGLRPCTVLFELRRGDETLRQRPVDIELNDSDRWVEIEVPLGAIAAGDEIRATSTSGEWRSFHYWLLDR